jgi:uncharacterized membrane protein
MNASHLHIILNHFPIIGLIFGLGILITGLILKNESVKNTAFVVFIIATIFGFLSMYTGDGAKEMVENLPNIGHKIIHEHEELAERFMIALYATAFFALLSLIANAKQHKFAKLFSFITLTISIIGAVLSQGVGTSGGEIRHTEIREKANLNIKKPVKLGHMY